MAPSAWPSATIGSLIDSGVITGHKDGNYGSNYPRVDEFGSVGVPFLTAKLLRAGQIDIDAAPRLEDAKADRLRFGFVEPGDVLLSHNATIGRVAVVPAFDGRLLIGTSLTYFRVDPSKLSPRYFAACLAGPDFQNQLMAVMSHTTRNQVPITEQRRLSVVIPPFAEQEAIAEVFGSLDDKIELNRKTNETIEAIARALFKSWFIDFDPVRAKAEGRAPVGMDVETARLFPSEFVDSQLGTIPTGWRAATLGESSKLVMGQSPPGDTYNEARAGVPFFQGSTDFGFRFPSLRVFCTAPTRHARVGDSLVSVRAPVGEMNMARVDCALGRGVAAVRHGSGSRSFTYYLVGAMGPHFARYNGEGTVFGSINKSGFESIVHVEPPPELVRAFDAIVGPLDDCIEVTSSESEALAALRDALLPRLLSGELRLPGIVDA